MLNKFYAKHRPFIFLWLALMIVVGGSGYLVYSNPPEIAVPPKYPINAPTTTTVIQENTNGESPAETIPIQKKLETKEEETSPPSLKPEKNSTSTEISNETKEADPPPRTTDNNQNNQPFRLVVNEQTLEFDFAPGDTLYQAMTVLAADNKITFHTINYPGIGQFVDEINGVKNDQKKGMFWIYYINGVSAKIGVSQYLIKPNEIITWKYEKSKF